MSLSREALDKILEIAHPPTQVVAGLTYAVYEGRFALMVPPMPDELVFATLSGLVGYLEDGPDADVNPEDLVVHVESPSRVSVYGGPDGHRRRVFAAAMLLGVGFKFGEFMAQDAFVVGLRTLFVQTTELEQLAALVSSLTVDEIRTTVDNGVTQEVTARAGVRLSDRVTLPNPVTLCPFRTFRDAVQPSSIFLLRARKGRSAVDGVAGIELALYEADGGAWQLAAVDSVRVKLCSLLPSEGGDRAPWRVLA